MTLSSMFVEVARGMLPPATFDEIYTRAVTKERERVQKQPVAPAGREVTSKAVTALVASHLSGDPPPLPQKPHAQERLEDRMGIEIGQGDLAELLNLVRAGGPNVQVVGQRMELTQEVVANWRGKHFVVVWSKSRNKLITAMPKKRKKKQKVRTGRPVEARQDYMEECEA